ncbi:MAG: rod shape-determining protein RodA [Parcubacteria group bacterium]|nr:rod shape-determining protein RodA [Parcubacteria group bacterium]
MWFLKKLDWWLLGAVLFLASLGLVMLISLSSREPEPLFWFWRQLFWLGVGALVFLIFSLIDYRVFRNSSAIVTGIYLFAILLLTLVLFFGKTIRGNRAWFEFGSFTFQPVEFAKIALILVLAKYFSQHHMEIWRFRHIIISGIFLALPFLLVLLQPDWGSALTLVTLWFGMVLLSGARAKQVILLLVFFALFSAFAWYTLLTPVQKARISSFLQPNLDPYGSAYNQRQALIAIGSGGFFGRGLAQGSQTQLKFLPASRTDFMFAAIGEELGFFGIFAVLSAFALTFFRIGRIAILSGNNFSRLFSLGFLILLLAHVFINIGMNLGFLPVIGIVLPFVSYGGSSITALFSLLGILMSIKARV